VDQSPMNQPMDDDQPLFLPEEFEREHLEEARRAVAQTRGGRAVARRVTSATIPRMGDRARTRLGIAVLVHAVAALMVLVIAIATGTWLVGLAMWGMLVISLGVTARVLHVMDQSRAPSPTERPTSRPRPRRPH